MAAEDGGLPRRTIPRATPHDIEHDRWLLKLHGTVDDPETIVLTRSDYLGFNTERAALSSIVKATLMTRHVLFVGFGMRDDHFHEIIHDVRRAMVNSGATLDDIGRGSAPGGSAPSIFLFPPFTPAECSESSLQRRCSAIVF